MATDNPIPSFLMPAIIKAYKDRKKLEAQMHCHDTECVTRNVSLQFVSIWLVS